MPVLQLRKLKSYQAGWDGLRSKEAVASSFELAEKFLKLVKDSAALFKIEPTIFSAGNAALEIQTEIAELLLEFYSDEIIVANIDTESKEIDIEIEGFDGKAIPPELKKYF